MQHQYFLIHVALNQKQLLLWQDSILQIQSINDINALVFLKHIFQKEEQEKIDRMEKERLERIELLHQQASAKNLDKHSMYQK